MRFPHCIAIFCYLPWLSKTKVSYKKSQHNEENACGNRMCKISLNVTFFKLRGEHGKTYSWHGDEHEVDTIAVAEVRIVSVLEVLPRVAGILHKMAEAGRSQNLKKTITINMNTLFLLNKKNNISHLLYCWNIFYRI